MKKTFSLMALSFLAAQPAFSSASDTVPVEEAPSLVSIPSFVDNDIQRVIVPVSDPELEGRTSSLLKNFVVSERFSFSSRPRKDYMPSLSSIPEGVLMNDYDISIASRKIRQNLVKAKENSEKENNRLSIILEENEEEALRIELPVNVRERKNDGRDQSLRNNSSRTLVMPRARTLKRFGRLLRENM